MFDWLFEGRTSVYVLLGVVGVFLFIIWWQNRWRWSAYALAGVCAAARRNPKPIACAIQGHCLGGALELAACCDVRICTLDAQLGMPEVFLGIPSVIDAVMLGHHIGVGRARELTEPVCAPCCLTAQSD